MENIKIVKPTLANLEEVLKVEKSAWPDIGTGMVAEYEKFKTRIKLGTINLLYLEGEPADYGARFHVYNGAEAVAVIPQAMDDPEKYVQVREKEKIDLGNFQFEVICTPGHDSTSICLLEREKKMVFTGDLLYDGKLYYSFPDSDLRKYLSSLKKIQDTRPKLVCGGHNAPVANSVKTFISSKIKEIESAISMKQRKI